MKQLKALRKANGLNMKELGSKVGLSESTISLYENGKRQPDNETMLKFADFFGVSVDYLLGRQEEPTPTLTDEEKELFNLITQLTDEEVEELSKFVDFILSKRRM
jgi:transcriptional regulator with XRE-family HTH domain